MTGVEGHRLRGWLLRLARTLTLRQLVLSVAAVVVLASGLFGGLATATTTAEGPAALVAGTRVHAEPFDVTVQRLRWLDDLGPAVTRPEGRYVGVVATVENTTDHPVYLDVIRRFLHLSDVEGVDPDATPQVLVVADSAPLSSAAPGLEYEVVLLWDQAADAAPPTRATVSVRSHTWRQSTLDDQMLWFDPAVTHRGTFEVRPGGES